MVQAPVLVLLIGCLSLVFGGAQRAEAQVGAVTGCYQVRLVTPDRAGDERFFEWIPNRMRLDSTVVKRVRVVPATWRTVVLDSQAVRLSPRYDGGWRLLGSDSLRVSWGDGFVGLDLTFHVVTDTLRGTATYESDVAGNIHFATIVAWRISCANAEPHGRVP